MRPHNETTATVVEDRQFATGSDSNQHFPSEADENVMRRPDVDGEQCLRWRRLKPHDQVSCIEDAAIAGEAEKQRHEPEQEQEARGALAEHIHDEPVKPDVAVSMTGLWIGRRRTRGKGWHHPHIAPGGDQHSDFRICRCALCSMTAGRGRFGSYCGPMARRSPGGRFLAEQPRDARFLRTIVREVASAAIAADPTRDPRSVTHAEFKEAALLPELVERYGRITTPNAICASFPDRE
jgi:hypothetical protein